MKLAFCLPIIAVLCIAATHGRQQEPPFNESLAYARLVAASKLPTVTAAQCLAARYMRSSRPSSLVEPVH